MPRDPFPPLLNEYKYTLARRRVLRTLTGGIKLRTGIPYPIHAIQWLLWILPLVITVPFMISAMYWNVYYIALIGSFLCGLLTLSIGITVKLILRKSRQVPSYCDDDEEDHNSEDIRSLFSVAALVLVFSQRNWIDVIVHAVSSTVLCYSSIVLLDLFTLIDIVSLPATPFVFIAGSVALCTSHYSLLVQVPIEISIYRQIHQDRLHLSYLRRPVYIVFTCIMFVSLRLTNVSSTYLIIPYVFLSLLPILWTMGILPPLDALVFWIMEQCLVHLMGGSPAPSEIRMLVHFLLSLVPFIGLVFISNRYVIVILASALGFILSQNVCQHMLLLLKHISQSSRCYSPRSRVFASTEHWFTSYYMVDFHNRVQSALLYTVVSIVVGVVKSMVLLSFTVVASSLSYNRKLSNGIISALSYSIVGLFVIVEVSKLFSGAFLCLGLIRNPLHPFKIEQISKLKRRKSLLTYLALPYQILTLYVGPLVMVVYVTVLLDYKCRIASNFWFGLTTIRLYRKIWQNSSACLLDVVIIAIFYLSLSDDCGLVLGIGPLSLIISFSIYFTRNFIQRFKFFIILLISFITSYSNNPVFYKSFVLSVLLLPMSLFFVLTSALFSAPLIPIFTLPIMIMSFPRPRIFWPSLLAPKSHSETQDSFYYKQALPAIAKCISYGSKTGAYSANPGSSFLIRFQDRLSIVRFIEKGHGYSLIHIQGLELQETSCHTTEATSIDDVRDTLYSDRRNSCLWFINRYPLFHLHPVDVSIGLVYSDAHSSLSGIIDSHDSLSRFSENLYKALIWVFVTNNSYSNSATGTRTDGEIPGNASSSSIISPSHVRIKSPKVHPTSASGTKSLPATVPFNNTELSDVLSSFPLDWFHHVMTKYGTRTSRNNVDTLKHIITSCYIIMDVPAFSDMFNTSLSTRTQPSHVYRRFCGDHSFLLGKKTSKCRKWFEENPGTEDLVNEAYRYAVKLLYDEAVLGEISNFTELQESLEEYDNHWYIAQEEKTADDWRRNIINETRSLFSMGFTEPNTYTAHILTLQDEVLFLGELNQSLVEGIWSNLVFELQYLTNDDEERYSVQAQARLMRNLMTQGAEVPYGYQVYSSELVTISSI